MDDIKVTLDEKQLTRVIKSNGEAQPFWKTERFIQLVQIALIVLSGVWILIQFFDYGREASHISLRRDELAAEMMQLTLNTQGDGKK